MAMSLVIRRPNMFSVIRNVNRFSVIRKAYISTAVTEGIPDTRYIQGDIWPGLPKKHQSFLFFRIQNAKQFRERLKSFIDEITTGAQAKTWKDEICRETKQFEKHAPRTGVNISFASTGMAALGIYTLDPAAITRNKKLRPIYVEQQYKCDLFKKGMYADLVGEGWDDPNEIREQYRPIEGETKNRTIDGVIMVTSIDKESIQKKVEDVRKHFGSAIKFTLIKDGQTLPGDKEHFGFRDGISQPLIEGLDEIKDLDKKAPRAVKPGLIFSRRTGGDDDTKQPEWALDGSFLVFRDLQQLVPEFNEFMRKNADSAPFSDSLGQEEKAEKLAAHLMGRWKNGTSVDVNPENDVNLHPNPNELNSFDYHPIKDRDVTDQDVKNHDRCPFAAHTRKMRPRGDEKNDSAVIIRRGIPYEEEDKETRQVERGLLFVCYQSDIRSGFQFLTAPIITFQENKTSFVGEGGPGIDPIVGQRPDDHPARTSHPARSIGLPDGKRPTEARLILDKWVIHRGGEYFFTPSVKALREYITGPAWGER